MISVCMATYNGDKYVEAQLKSILSQLSPEDEVLISDDGSVDATVSLITSINDPRIRLINNSSGGLGIVKNFEHVLLEARGDYVFLSDQDDIWLESKVFTCVEVLKKYTLVVTDCEVVDSDLKQLSASFFRLRNSRNGLMFNIWKNRYLGCCMAFRRELLDVALPMPTNIPMHDMWLGLIAEITGSVLFLPKVLSKYRRHASVASATAGKSTYGIFEKIKIRLILITHLLARTLLTKIKDSRR